MKFKWKDAVSDEWLIMQSDIAVIYIFQNEVITVVACN